MEKVLGATKMDKVVFGAWVSTARIVQAQREDLSYVVRCDIDGTVEEYNFEHVQRYEAHVRYSDVMFNLAKSGFHVVGMECAGGEVRHPDDDLWPHERSSHYHGHEHATGYFHSHSHTHVEDENPYREDTWAHFHGAHAHGHGIERESEKVLYG